METILNEIVSTIKTYPVQSLFLFAFLIKLLWDACITLGNELDREALAKEQARPPIVPPKISNRPPLLQSSADKPPIMSKPTFWITTICIGLMLGFLVRCASAPETVDWYFNHPVEMTEKLQSCAKKIEQGETDIYQKDNDCANARTARLQQNRLMN